VKTRAVVVSTGARTALGLSALETAFLLRTGSSGLGASPLVDAEGEPVTMAFDPTLEPLAIGAERAVALGLSAMEEAMRPVSAVGAGLRAALVLCVSERFADKERVAEGATLAGRLHLRARELVPGIDLETSARGPASAAFALSRALDALASGGLDAVLLGGAHSDYDPAVVRALQAERRLFRPSAPFGVLLGEAAAFVLLAREDVARRLRMPPLARVWGVGSAMERATPTNDVSAFEATGLTRAVRAATAELAAEELRVGHMIVDHGFEVRRLHEWQAMVTRTQTLWGEPSAVDAPAQRLGHLGAAALPLALVLAAEGHRRGHAPSPIALATAATDSGERGAILVARG
jgi:3-oxoacyl-[acyl-carrier-protein] synthase-1